MANMPCHLTARAWQGHVLHVGNERPMCSSLFQVLHDPRIE